MNDPGVCSGCGAEVLAVSGDLGGPGGAVVVADRLMVRREGRLVVREHLCRDYRAWHLPPDRRDVFTLDVPGEPAWRGRFTSA